MPLVEMTATELLTLQSAGKATAAEIADAFLAAYRVREPKLKAFMSLDEAAIRAQADAVDAKRSRKQRLGKLAGVPVAIKDVLCT